MPTPSHTIVCTGKRLVAPNVYELAFQKPALFPFKSGQFVLFDVPLLTHPDDIQPRALSIASSPNEGELLFAVKLKEGGRASEWVKKTLHEGISARMQGPLGLFTITPEESQRYVFVATGAGVAPFRGQLKWLLEEMHWKGPLDLIFGVRSRGDFFWTEEFKALAEQFSNFHLHLTLSSPDADWTGKSGRVQSHLQSVMQEPSKTSVYICGAPEMVQNNKQYCLTTLGLQKKQVHAEGYI